jgi:hypothetical protein
MHNHSDNESDLEEDDPLTPGEQTVQTVPRVQNLQIPCGPQHVNLNSDSDEEDSTAPRRLGRSHARGPTVQRLTRIDEPVSPQPSSQSSGLKVWRGYHIDQDNYAWAEDDVLQTNTKSADCQAFFGQHIEHCGFKCKLCP